MGYDEEFFSAPDVYYSALSRHSLSWLGHPLWYPEPDATGEVRIGDVGYIDDGRFRRFFNVVKDHGFPDGREPDEFTPLQYNVILLDLRNPVLPPGPQTSTSVVVKEGAVTATGPSGAGVQFEAKFTLTRRKGAILHLKNPASKLSIPNNKTFTEYMRKHHRNWLAFVQREFGFARQPDDLILVRGWVKTSEWAVCALQSNSRTIGGGLFASFEPIARAGFQFKLHKGEDTMCAHNSGPTSSNNISSPPPSTQCIFLCYHKIKYRWLLPPKIMAAAGPAPLPDQSPNGDNAAVIAVTDIDVETEATEVQRPFDPVDAILDYILANSDAEVAIASDGDLEELLQGRELPENIDKYLTDKKPEIHTNTDTGTGSLSIQSAIFEKQYRRRGQHAHHGQDEEADSRKHVGQGSAERVVLADGKTLQWLDLVFRDSTVEAHTSGIFSISSTGEHIVTCSGSHVIELWDLRIGAFIRQFPHHEQSVLSMDFSPDGTKFVSGSADNTGRLWNIGDASQTTVLRGHSEWVSVVAYSPDGATVATGSLDKTACIWNPNGEKLFTLTQDGEVTSLQYSPDGTSLLSCADIAMYLWDCSTGARKAVLNGHTDIIWVMKFSRQGDRIVSCDDDGTSRIWDAVTGLELVTLREHAGPVWSIDLSPEGDRVVSCGHDSTIAMCNSFTGERQYSITEGSMNIRSLAYSHDGKYIASGDGEGLVKLWDAVSGGFVAEFHGHENKVKDVAWSPDDRSVVSSSHDGSIRAWSISDLLRIC